MTPNFDSPKLPERLQKVCSSYLPGYSLVYRTLSLKPGAKLLDYGCAIGNSTHFFQLQGYDVEGIDNDAGCIRQGRREYSDLKFHVLPDDEKIPFKDNYFEGVFSTLVHARTPGRYAIMHQEIHRVLKPGGPYGIMVKHPDYIAWSKENFPETFQPFPWTEEVFRDALEPIGFDITKVLEEPPKNNRPSYNLIVKAVKQS